jgi:hypothetical protein
LGQRLLNAVRPGDVVAVTRSIASRAAITGSAIPQGSRDLKKEGALGSSLHCRRKRSSLVRPWEAQALTIWASIAQMEAARSDPDRTHGQKVRLGRRSQDFSRLGAVRLSRRPKGPRYDGKPRRLVNRSREAPILVVAMCVPDVRRPAVLGSLDIVQASGATGACGRGVSEALSTAAYGQRRTTPVRPRRNAPARSRGGRPLWPTPEPIISLVCRPGSKPRSSSCRGGRSASH